MSLLTTISITAFRLSLDNVAQSRFFTNFIVEKLRSHATFVVDKVNKYLYAKPIFLYVSECILCFARNEWTHIGQFLYLLHIFLLFLRHFRLLNYNLV